MAHGRLPAPGRRQLSPAVTIALADGDVTMPQRNIVTFLGAFNTLKHAGEGMDVDGNGVYDALTDGLLMMMRYLLIARRVPDRLRRRRQCDADDGAGARSVSAGDVSLTGPRAATANKLF